MQCFLERELTKTTGQSIREVCSNDRDILEKGIRLDCTNLSLSGPGAYAGWVPIIGAQGQ